MKKLFSVILLAALLLCGCSQQSSLLAETTPSPAVAATIPTPTDMFSNRDLRTEPEDGTYSIVLSDSGITTDCTSVLISGTTVTITEEADYRISGSLSDGMVIVDTDSEAKLQLILDSVSVHSSTSAALYIKQADKVVVTLTGENLLSSGESYTAIDENNIDAAVFSKDDLSFNGSGSLTVTAPVGHGITAKDDLVLTGGTYTVTCANHGLDANDSIRISDSSITIAAGKDGIHAENDEDAALGFVYIESGTMSIVAEGDGISGSAYVQIQDGTFDILSGGGSVNGQQQTSSNYGGFGGGMGPGGGGMMPGGGGGRYAIQTLSTTTTTTESSSIKGIKAGTDLLISAGSFTIDAADDALHANASVTIANGTFTLSSGDDGVHADETLCISGGSITVTESYEGLEALNVQITGGDMTLTCSDDGINAAGGTDSSGYGGIRGDQFGGGMGGSSNGSIVISGGTIYMNASGDGIDANGSLVISGGHTTVCGPTTGDTAVLDYDTTAEITGGTFIGTGSSMMAQSFTSSQQGVIALSVGNQAAGTAITLKDKNGNVLISVEPKLNYAIVILSCPDMVKGESYTVSVGSLSDTFEAS